MVQLDHSGEGENQQPTTYGLGNPNVQYQKTPWDVFLSLILLVVVSIGILIWSFDLSLVGFGDWLGTLFSGGE